MLAYLVRIGFAGDCFVAGSPPDDSAFQEPLAVGAEVLVQTPRGIELGEILAPIRQPPVEPKSLKIIRELTADDRLLVERLGRHKRDAVRRCQDVLAARGSAAVLLDVDQLFDGNTLILHFLGPVDALDRESTNVVLAEYEAEVRSIRLAELMTHGCGPDCGTEDAEGAGCGSPAGCANCPKKCR